MFDYSLPYCTPGFLYLFDNEKSESLIDFYLFNNQQLLSLEV